MVFLLMRDRTTIFHQSRIQALSLRVHMASIGSAMLVTWVGLASNTQVFAFYTLSNIQL
jgi:hypothetical protein